MSRSHEERQDIRGEGVLNSANNRALNPVMSASSLEKEKHEKQILGKLNSGNEPSGYRAVDLMKPSNKQMNSSITHLPAVGSAPLPPIPPLQAPLLTSILPGPGHPLIPPGLSHTSLLRGGTLPAQIPLMGKAAAAVAPPRASIVAPSLRASSIPLLKTATNPSQIQITGKGSSIFSPIGTANRVSSSSPGSVLSRPNEHTRIMEPKLSQSEIHSIRGGINSSNVTQIPGTATVQVIASGTASVAHPAVLSQPKPFPVIPSANVLKIGSSNPQHSQTVTSMISTTTVSMTTAYKTAAPQNSITISKIYPQPILIPSTTSGATSTTRPDLQDHQKVISSNASHGRHTPPVSSNHHPSHAHYGLSASSYATSHQAHVPHTTNASADGKNDRLKPGNPSLQYAIGSYFPIDSSFPHSLSVHPFTQSSQYAHRYVQALAGNNSALGSFPMFVEGTRGFAAPLPIPGMTAPARDSHHHASPAAESPIMNNSYALHNFPNLQPSNYHANVSSSNTSSSRPGPGILRKRTVDGYTVHGIDRISSPTKQDIRTENRTESYVASRSESAPTRQESPRLLCDEKSTFNDNYIPPAETLTTNSSKNDINSSMTEIKKEIDLQPEKPSSSLLANTSHQNLLSSNTGPTTEASPRKKPRKQNVITTEDKYSSKVSIEAEEEIDYMNKKQQHQQENNKKEIKKDAANLFRIQKPIPKLKLEETVIETKEPEPPELDETSNYYNFIRKPKYNVLGDYKINTKAAYHHFYRYSDVKAKEEKKPSTTEIANNKRILQNISGWRMHHMSSQMDDLCALENEVCNKLFEFQRELPRPSKHYMITTACHDIQNGRKVATVDEQLRVLHELIQGNIQRCQLGIEQIGEAKQTMLRVLDHKPKVLEIIKRHKHKRSSKKKLHSFTS